MAGWHFSLGRSWMVPALVMILAVTALQSRLGHAMPGNLSASKSPPSLLWFAQAQPKDPQTSIQELNDAMVKFVSVSNNLAKLYNQASLSVAETKKVLGEIDRVGRELSVLGEQIKHIVKTTDVGHPEAARLVQLALQSYGAYQEAVGKMYLKAYPNLEKADRELSQAAQ